MPRGAKAIIGEGEREGKLEGGAGEMGGGLGDVEQLPYGGGGSSAEFSGRGWLKKAGRLPVVAAVLSARRLKRAAASPRAPPRPPPRLPHRSSPPPVLRVCQTLLFYWLPLGYW